jgi:hypothetical protein
MLAAIQSKAALVMKYIVYIVQPRNPAHLAGLITLYERKAAQLLLHLVVWVFILT